MGFDTLSAAVRGIAALRRPAQMHGAVMLLEAQKKWSLAPRKFGRAFRYQYVISQADLEIPQFRTFARLSWKLHAGDGLPVCELFDRNGDFAGYLIGIAVGPNRLIDAGANTLPFGLNEEGFWSDFETWLVEAAGRYAFLIEARGETRFYCDPVGMIGAVYNKTDRLLAASPLLAIFDDVVPNPKFDFDVIRDHGGKLSLFHTADVRVRRLNPNCYLDLAGFTEHRHWPKSETFAVSEDRVLSVYDEIHTRAAFNTGEICRAYPVAVPVSGGQDSRLILAFGKDHAHLVKRFYTHVNNYATRRDAAIGKKMCDALGLGHEVHDKRESSIAPRDRNQLKYFWNMALGVDAPMPTEYENGNILKLPQHEVVLRGHQTDLLRAVYVFKSEEHWGKAYWQIKRMLIVPHEMFGPEVVERFSDDFYAWQTTLPPNAMRKAADFMFLEVYYNAGIGAAFPALWRNFYLSPFNSRRLIALSLSFSEAARRISHPVFDIIERHCAELSGIPFDFELAPDLSLLWDEEHCRDVTGKRLRETRARLADFERAAKAAPSGRRAKQASP